MKTAAILLALFAAAGLNAQGLLNGQPACATSCLTSAISAAGCALTDVSCQCGPTITIIASSAIPCLVTACADNDVQGVINAQTAACGGFCHCYHYVDVVVINGVSE
ncbi:hypothetical protein B0T18DRAFT_427501 [Schizothecium vesticola]|uniref:CFEM domain-containing protein n=1 Tax=Schizothecium vesticola TaxID=314040 RepID=A0AA40F1A6_9PEZI|nr:hypothetical protein B0T18DRAFT_427501 [Schizothecium vesticola]